MIAPRIPCEPFTQLLRMMTCYIIMAPLSKLRNLFGTTLLTETGFYSDFTSFSTYVLFLFWDPVRDPMLNWEALPFDLFLHLHLDNHRRVGWRWLQRWAPGSSTENFGSHPAAVCHILQRVQAREGRKGIKNQDLFTLLLPLLVIFSQV